MGCLGNLIWFLCGGLLQGLSWTLAGLLWCITIIGIPIGRQCFKFASVAFFPFGKEVQYGGGTISLLANIVWIYCVAADDKRPAALYNDHRYSLWPAVL